MVIYFDVPSQKSTPVLIVNSNSHKVLAAIFNYRYSPSKSFSLRELWIFWAVCLLIAFIIQLYTIDVLPHLQQDEAQITEYGRLILHPESDWSINWRLKKGKPLLLWSYLGPLIAELSFQVGGVSGLGPRVASVLGAMLAATMAFGWLLSRNLPRYAAFGLSIAFLLDPLFVLSQRMGRVDSWVFALCLGCCWLLRLCLNKDKHLERWLLPISGGLTATAALVWPSAIFLFPLILFELFQMSSLTKKQGQKWKILGEKILLFGMGGVITTLLLLFPIWPSIVAILSDSAAMISGNIDTTKTVDSSLFGLFYHQHWFKLIKALIKTWTPIFPALAIAGMIIHRQNRFIVIFLIAVTIIFASLVYEFRVLYLLPYFLVLSSGLFLKRKNIGSDRFKSLHQTALGLLILWSVFISLGLRTAFGVEVKSEKDRNKIYKAASKTIGPGAYNVYMDFTYEFYFVGRSLGWKLYTPYIQYFHNDNGNWLRKNDHQPEEDFLKLLSRMDYALFYEQSVTPELEKQLSSTGLYYSDVIKLNSDFNATPSKRSRNEEIFLYFLRGNEEYGSYVLFSR